MNASHDATDPVVLDASTLVDILVDAASAATAKARLAGIALHAPAHLDAEALSALGRLHRSGSLSDHEVSAALERVAALPTTRHPISELLGGAWARRGELRLVDALYVELASQLGTRVITTDAKLARASDLAESVRADA